MGMGSEGIAFLVWSHERASVVYTMLGYDWKVHCILLHIGLCYYIQSAYADHLFITESTYNGHVSWNWTMEQCKKVVQPHESLFSFTSCEQPGDSNRIHSGKRQANVLLGNCRSCIYVDYIDTNLLHKHRCRSSTWQQYSLMMVASFGRIMCHATWQTLFRNNIESNLPKCHSDHAFLHCCWLCIYIWYASAYQNMVFSKPKQILVCFSIPTHGNATPLKRVRETARCVCVCV